MKIKEIKSEHGNDFYAVFECEHCGVSTTEKAGYHDNFFHTKVIPGQRCPNCHMNRAGDIASTENVSQFLGG